MKYEIIDKSDRGWVLIKTYGSYSADGDASILKELSLLDYLPKLSGFLVDYSQTSFVKTDLITVKQAVQITASADNYLGLKRCAIIIPADGYSKAAMYKYDLDSIINMKTEIFSTDEYKRAVHWLESNE